MNGYMKEQNTLYNIANQDSVHKKLDNAITALDTLNKMKNNTIDPVTGQPGDLYGAPTKPSPQWLEYQKNLEAESIMDSLGIQRDPMLEGTGQPGELYGAPKGKPSSKHRLNQIFEMLKIYQNNKLENKDELSLNQFDFNVIDERDRPGAQYV